MPSAKQIKARKEFVKKYAKKGKRSKSSVVKSSSKKSNPHPKDLSSSSDPERRGLKSYTGYTVASPRFPDGRTYKTYEEAEKEFNRQIMIRTTPSISDKNTHWSNNPKWHPKGKFWTAW
jgi:hypothetical protein